MGVISVGYGVATHPCTVLVAQERAAESSASPENPFRDHSHFSGHQGWLEASPRSTVSVTRTTMFILVQITAAVGALAFGWIQDRLGALRTYRITLWMWILAVALIHLTPTLSIWLQAAFGVHWQAQEVFLVVGCAAGLSLGSCQSATRTLVGLFAPRSRAGEFFGFWGLTLKLAGASGLLLIGLLQALVGLRTAILVCVLLFFLAWLASLGVDQQRGESAAAEPGHG